MTINKEKCNAWIEMMMAILKMTNELNEDELDYIKAHLLMMHSQIILEELEAKDEQSNK